MKAEVKLTGFDGALEALQSLPPELVSGSGGGVIGRGLRKGANVLRDQAKVNLRHATSNARKNGDSGTAVNTGWLEKNLVVARGRRMTVKGERMFVRIRRRAAYPGREEVTAVQTGYLLELGSSKQPREPWLEPAFQSRSGAALQVVQTEVMAGIKKAVAKAEQLAKGKG